MKFMELPCIPRGKPGARQVEGAKTGLTHGVSRMTDAAHPASSIFLKSLEVLLLQVQAICYKVE